MGVYINMEMPTEGYIDVRIKCNGTASFAIADNPYFKAVEAVPVPPHGKLVDADVLVKAAVEDESHDVWGAYAREVIVHKIQNAPTVIEAEEGET